MVKVRSVIGVILVLAAAPALAQTMYRWVDKSGGVHYSDTPPPAEVKDVKEKKIGAASYVEVGPSYGARRAQQDFPVTFYRDPECSAACKDARAVLEKRGVPFSEVVLKSDEDMDAFKRSFGVDKAQIPAVTVGGQKQIGLEEGLWNRLLDEAGYPKSAPPGARSAARPAAAPVPALPPAAQAPAPTPAEPPAQ